MKKIIILLSFGFVSVIMYGQDPSMIGTWYLRGFTADLGETEFINNNDAPQNPTLIINADFSFEGIGACNTFSGQLTYDAVEDVYVHDSFTPTTINCEDDGYTNFEAFYFSHFDDSQGTFLRLVDIGNDLLYLEIESPGFGLEFQNTVFLDSPDNLLQQVSVYPTLVTQSLMISVPQNLDYRYRIVDSLGKEIRTGNHLNSNINVSDLDSGLYFIQITTSTGKLSKKFIKK